MRSPPTSILPPDFFASSTDAQDLLELHVVLIGPSSTSGSMPLPTLVRFARSTSFATMESCSCSGTYRRLIAAQTWPEFWNAPQEPSATSSGLTSSSTIAA